MDLIKGEESVDELLKAQAHVWNHSYRFVGSMCLKCAVELAIPDIIHNHGEPMTISELALALSIHPTKVNHIYRLMSILVHLGFFTEHQIPGQSHKEKGYKLTLPSKFLLKDNPMSVSPLFLTMLDPDLLKLWQYASAWFKNEDAEPFITAHGKTGWEYVAEKPKIIHSFNEAMAHDSLLVANAMLSKCRGVFEGLKSLVDVGGGTGTLLKVLAKTFPNMDCTVFDLPHVVAGLQGSGNLKYMGGNIFENVPSGEAIMLKWILHDWTDEDCVKILKSCKEAIRSNDKEGKVIILEFILDNQEIDEKSRETQLLFDMEIMATTIGRERNEQEWSKLFAEAGFKNYKIHHILGIRSLIELFP